MNILISVFGAVLFLCNVSQSMEKPNEPLFSKKITSYLQKLPPDLWRELFLYMSQPGSIIDNRGDVIIQTHAKARTFCDLALEYMNLPLADNKLLNKNFLRASYAYVLKKADSLHSFYLPNEISLACALHTPGSKEALKEELDRQIQQFKTLSQEDKNKTLLDVARRCPSARIMRALIAHGAQINCRAELSHYTPLRYAVETGRVSLVRSLLKRGAQANISDRYFTNPLMRATTLGQGPIVALLASKTNINMINLFGETALYSAARRGDIGCMKHLLNNKARILIADNTHEKNVFSAAVEAGSLEALDLLLEVDEPALHDGFYYTSFLNFALKRAVGLGNRKMVNYLLYRSENFKFSVEFQPKLCPDYIFSEGYSALVLALANNHTRIAKQLINYARDRYYKQMNAHDDARSLALSWAVSKIGDPQIKKENPALVDEFKEIIQLLMEDDTPNPLGNKKVASACFFAAHQENLELLTQLFKIAQKRIDNPVERALHEAIDKISTWAVSAILQHKPNINWANEQGETALLKAALHVNRNTLAIFDMILQMSANYLFANQYGIAPVHAVIHNTDAIARRYCIEQLKNAGALIDAADYNGDTPLLLASVKRTDMAETAELLINFGADCNHANKQGNTPLIYAVDRNNEELVRLLLKHGADPNKRNNSGCGPLTKAARVANPVILQLLLDAGARIDDFKDAMLRQAAKANNGSLIKMLIEQGARINSGSSSMGNTALHKAVLKLELEPIRLLLKLGADPRVKNHKGETPLELALNMEDAQIVHVLQQH